MRADRRAIREDGKRLLEAAHARGRVALAATWLALLWDRVFVGARHDIAQALRALVRYPGVTVGISFLLGLGVAATTTLFAFVDAALLRPLPYDQPDRLVMVWESNVSQDRLREGPSPGNVLDWAARNDAFDAITASMTVSATLRGRDGGAPVTGVHVTRGFFDVYRRQPRLGRTFHADEFEGAASITSRQPSSGEPVIVLSHRLWQALGGQRKCCAHAALRRRTAGSRHARDGRCRASGGRRGRQLVAGPTCRIDRPRARDEDLKGTGNRRTSIVVGANATEERISSPIAAWRFLEQGS